MARTVPITVRCDLRLSNYLNKYCNEMGIPKKQVVELALVDFFKVYPLDPVTVKTQVDLFFESLSREEN